MEEVIHGLELKQKRKIPKCHMLTILEFLNLVYWNDNIGNALLAWALPSSLSDLISGEENYQQMEKNNPMCWLNEKPTRPSHKEEMSQSSVSFNWHDTCNRKGLYLHSAWQHTTQVFKAGEPIGDTVCHKQIPSRLLDTFHFNPICKTLTFLINCESKSPGFARLCVKCKREYLNLSVNKQTHKSKARWGESSSQYPGCNPCLLFNFKMTNQWQNGIK